MDRDLAGAVLRRWDAGLPVTENAMYKAASVLGINPALALAEARFYTHLDSYILEKRAMTKGERIFFSLAAGIDPYAMVKTASAHGFCPEELILEALRDRDWVPDLRKIALTIGAPPEELPSAVNMADPSQVAAVQQATGMMAQPQPDATVQQAAAIRMRPSPTAPEQIAASPNGNLDALLKEHQGVFGQQAQENGGMPAAGMPEPPPPPPSPEERIQQVAPDIDAETVARYGEQLSQFEQQMGMPVADPKQMSKLIKEFQKVDGKRIDKGIKAMGEQLVQQQDAEFDGAQSSAVPPQQVSQQAVEKVANVARFLARLNMHAR